MSIARWLVVTGCTFIHVLLGDQQRYGGTRVVVRCGIDCGSLVARSATLGWLLKSWLTMMRLLHPSPWSSRSTCASRQSRSSPALHIHFKKYVSSSPNLSWTRLGSRTTSSRPPSSPRSPSGRSPICNARPLPCWLLANRFSVVPFAGLGCHSRF